MRLALAAAIGLVACSGAETEKRSAADQGRELFASPETSPAKDNLFACATCHPDAGAEPGRIFPGYTLAGATARPTFWGGQHVDLLRAINTCRLYFMRAPAPWSGEEVEARAIYAFLESLPKTAPNALSFTVPVRISEANDLAPSDAARGAVVYDSSCKGCHGAARTGVGRLRDTIPILPDEPANRFASLYGFTKAQTRLAFIEKVRHGPFLQIFGNMPLYSKEALSDADLAALLSFLALH